MVKIKILDSGLIKEVEDETLCCDMWQNLMRIGDSNVGDRVFIASVDQTEDEEVQIVERTETKLKLDSEK